MICLSLSMSNRTDVSSAIETILSHQPKSRSSKPLSVGKLKSIVLIGKEELHIPPGTQYGAQLRIPNKGVPHYRRSYSGDLVVRMEIETPRHLNTEERSALEEFAKLRGESHQSEHGGFWDKLLGRHDDEEPE